MRFVVLLIGLAGVALTAFVGTLYLIPDVLIDVIKEALADNKALADDIIKVIRDSPTGTSHGDTGVVLLAAAGYGFLGTMLVLCRCGWQGALLMLVPVICSTVMNPYSAAFTALLALAGLASFVVFPLPINAPKKSDDAEEEEEDKPKKAPKRKVDDED